MGNKSSKSGKHRSFQLKRKVEADLELFLIGRTGHGKSATGNTILGRKKFKSSDMAQSATLKTAAGWAHIGRHIVKVVDGPGLVDTRICGVKRLEQTEKNFMEGFVHCPDGFHALVLVLSYGTRFTDEEQKTVRLLKGMLGDDFIKKHCILAFTHGENFLMSNPDGNFEGWCRKQTGDLRQLMNECNNRVVLFYNLTPDKRDESIGRLMSLVYAFDERYTMEIFEQIHMKREEFILAEGAIQLKDLIQGKVDMTIDCLEKGRTNHHLDNLMQRLEEEIKKENKDLKVVMDVKQGIQKVRNKKYSEALQIFKVINYEADLLEFRFYSRAYMQLKQFMSEVPLDLFS